MYPGNKDEIKAKIRGILRQKAWEVARGQGSFVTKFIPWEQTSDGVPAELKTSQQLVTKSNFVLKRVSLAKMTDVSLISADFGGETVIFEPCLSVLLDMSTHVEFRGIYQSSPGEDDQDEGLLPSLALRQALWTRADDFKQFNMAESKRAYIESDKQMRSTIAFTRPELQTEIFQLLEDAKRLVRMGIKMDSVDRSHSKREEIQVRLDDATIHFTLSYTPYTQQSLLLETWIEQWVQSFAQIDFEKSLQPDHGCCISYTSSFMEYLNRFPE